MRRNYTPKEKKYLKKRDQILRLACDIPAEYWDEEYDDNRTVYPAHYNYKVKRQVEMMLSKFGINKPGTLK